jgi:putative flavoprotein involved in K+ transport
MRTIETVVIGGGQAGLACSRHLTAAGRPHVVLERGRVGERWRTGTWDSLHLLSPNWMNTLPGAPYRGLDPDGFLSAAAFARHLDDYALSFDAPVQEMTEVRLLRRRSRRFEVLTDDGGWRAEHVVLATGWCDLPAVPDIARDMARDLLQLAPRNYRDPAGLPPGGVLVVGASSSGVQLAAELRATGRDVTLAVGRHSRVPRRYRGVDIFWWLDRIGMLDRTIDQVPDASAARGEPSLQLVGRSDHSTLDLAALQALDVRLVGRVIGLDGHRVRIADDLPATVAAADLRMSALLARIDGHIDAEGFGGEVLGREPGAAIRLPTPTDELDLRAEGIGTVVWATGHRRAYPWLRLPVLDDRGELRQRRGLTPVPGLYVLGQRFQHHRSSNFIGGVGRDAAFVTRHLLGTSGGSPCDIRPAHRATTGRSSAHAPQAPRPPSYSPGTDCVSCSSSAVATAPTHCRRTR